MKQGHNVGIDGEYADYPIRSIKKRKGTQGRYSYLCSWDGYGSEEDTWESRIDLLADGYSQDVKKFDAEFSKTTKKPKAEIKSKRLSARTPVTTKSKHETNRARSRTPARKMPPPKLEYSSDDEESDEDTDSKSLVAVLKSKHTSVDREIEPVWKWLTWFLLSIICTSIMYTLKPTLKAQDQYTESIIDMTSLIVACLPMLISVYAIAKSSESDFAMFSMVICMWIVTFKFCESPLNVCSSLYNWMICTLFNFCEVPKNPTPDVYFCFTGWAIVMMFMENWKQPMRSHKSAPFSMFFSYYMISLGIIVYHASYSLYPFSLEDYLLVFLMFCAIARIKVPLHYSLIFFRTYPAQWIELIAVTTGFIHVMAELIRSDESYEGRLGNFLRLTDSMSEITLILPTMSPGTASNITVPLAKIIRDSFAWESTAAITVLSLVYHR